MKKLPVLLLPGTLGDERLWHHQLVGLSNLADCAVPNLTEHDNITHLGQAILSTAPRYFALVGFSLGGIVAQELLRQAPERILKLALIDTSTGKVEPEKLERFKTWRNADHAKFEETLKVLETWVHPENTSVIPLIQDMGRNLGREVFKRQAGVLLSQRNNDTTVLQAFRGATLIIHGQDDPVSSCEGNEQMASLFKRSRRVGIPSCGHYAPLEKPEIVTALLSYWLQEGDF